MKKFVFSLQRILAFKRSLYEKEKNTLAQLRMQRYSLEKQRAATLAQMLQRQAAFHAKAAQEGAGIMDVKSASFHRENAEQHIKQLDAEIARLDIAIEQQLQIVIQLDREIKSLEKLREKQWNEYIAENLRQERERILEMVSGQYVEQQAQQQAQGA